MVKMIHLSIIGHILMGKTFNDNCLNALSARPFLKCGQGQSRPVKVTCVVMKWLVESPVIHLGLGVEGTIAVCVISRRDMPAGLC